MSVCQILSTLHPQQSLNRWLKQTSRADACRADDFSFSRGAYLRQLWSRPTHRPTKRFSVQSILSNMSSPRPAKRVRFSENSLLILTESMFRNDFDESWYNRLELRQFKRDVKEATLGKCCIETWCFMLMLSSSSTSSLILFSFPRCVLAVGTWQHRLCFC